MVTHEKKQGRSPAKCVTVPRGQDGVRILSRIVRMPLVYSGKRDSDQKERSFAFYSRDMSPDLSGPQPSKLVDRCAH